MNVLLEVHKLQKNFSYRTGLFLCRRQTFAAVKPVTFTLCKSETLAIIGENGSGKSTLAKMLAGMIKPTSGEIMINNKRLYYGDFLYRSQRIRMILQDPSTSLNISHRIGHILDVPLRLNTSLDHNAREQRIHETLHNVGLRSDHAHYYPHMLASGQIQRIALARALILQPQIIVADEALASLDMSIRSQIINLMLELQQKYGISYIYVTQHLDMIKHISDQVMVMHHGTVVEYDNTYKVLNSPLHNQTKRLINSHFNMRGFAATGCAN
ncbi:Putrescine export system ATP-binding protein SapF [Candidatus Profftia lariciata]|uniref:peptide ABC transporter ATP-binding protein n=1 Tax=Candidatus Profftia lariciata TaxID=1987921 RepID=UPI001D00DF8B|nr:ATP-binding cassette domain-containing protein [Candidatus Profftia lariciata]UDG81448.1 Putrescine export system ATP-binding protein SapF [Candidatus Profftia lariciata]